GKTTTLRSIMGLTVPYRGRVRYNGVDITGRPAYQVAKLGLGFVPEERRIFPDLTVRQNLEVARKQAASADTREWTVEAGLGRVRRAQGRLLERRRAADADDRPHADGQSGSAAARRAVGRPGAVDRARPRPTDRPAEGAGADDPAVRAERQVRHQAQRPRLHPREGPGALRGIDRRAARQRRRTAPVSRPLGLLPDRGPSGPPLLILDRKTMSGPGGPRYGKTEPQILRLTRARSMSSAVRPSSTALLMNRPKFSAWPKVALGGMTSSWRALTTSSSAGPLCPSTSRTAPSSF